MKKLFSFFTIFLLTIAAAIPASAAYDVTLMTDGTTNVKDGAAWIGGTTHSVTANQLTTFSASNKNLMVRGSSNNSTFKAVKLNGNTVTKSGSGNGFSPNSYNCDLSNTNGQIASGLILVEVYSSRDASNPYTYPLTITINDVDGTHVKSISKAGTNLTSYSDVTFSYGQQFVVTVDKEIPLDNCVLSKGSSVTKRTSGAYYTYTFTPFPTPAGTTFTMNIPTDNQEYNLTQYVDNSDCVLAYKIDGEVKTGSQITYKANKTFEIYTKVAPLSASFNGSNLNFTDDTYNGQACYRATCTTPASAETLNLAFNGTFTTSWDLKDMILGYEVKHAWENTWSDVPDFAAAQAKNGTLNSTFVNGDTYTIYVQTIPTTNSNLTWVNATYNGQSCKKATFTPTAIGSLSMTFGGEFTTTWDLKDQILGYEVKHAWESTWSDVPGFAAAQATNGTLNSTFVNGDTYAVYALNAPACNPTLTWEDVTYNGTACKKATFTPTAGGELSMTFASSMQILIDADELPTGTSLSDFVLGDVVRYNASNNIAEVYGLSQYGSVMRPNNDNDPELLWVAGDYFVINCKAIPSIIHFTDEDYDPADYIIRIDREDEDGDPYYEYRIMPVPGGYLYVVFDEESQSGPAEEAKFTINIHADREGAAVATAYWNSGEVYQTVNLTTTNQSIECPESGKILVSITDRNRYAFMSCVDTNKNNLDFLQYDAPQSSDVTIKKESPSGESTSIGGMSASQTYNVSGHTFSVTTLDRQTVTQYTYNVNITDDASVVKVIVGPSSSSNSTENREITGLITGNNAIQYTEYDKFLIVCRNDGFQALYRVEASNATVSHEYIPPTDYIALTTGIAGGTMTVTVNRPEAADDLAFTIYVDDMEKIKTITKKSEAGERALNLNTFESGADNTVTFKNGTYTEGDTQVNYADYFEITYYADNEPYSVKLNGNDLAISSRTTKFEDWEVDDNGNKIDGTTTITYVTSYFYEVHPANGDHLEILFSAPVVVPTFTVNVDDASKVSSFVNNDQDIEHTLVNGDNTITIISSDDVYRLYTVGNVDASSITCSNPNVVIERKTNFYKIEGLAANDVLNIRLVQTYHVGVTLENEGTEGFINSAEINDEEVDVAVLTTDGYTVNPGDNFFIRFNYPDNTNTYTVNSIKVNDEERFGSSFYGVINIEGVTGDINVVVDVTRTVHFPYTITVNVPANEDGVTAGNAVTVDSGDINLADYYNYDENDQIIDPTQNTFTIYTSEADNVIPINCTTENYMISSVTVDGVAVEADEYGYYLPVVAENNAIVVNVVKVAFTDVLTVTYTGTFRGGNLMSTKRAYTLSGEPTQVINFNAAYEGAFRLMLSDDSQYDSVTLNGEAVEADDYGWFNFTPANGDELVINFLTEDEIEMNDKFVICLHGEVPETFTIKNHKGYNLELGARTEIDFNVNYSGEYTVRIPNISSDDKVFVDGFELTSGGTYTEEDLNTHELTVYTYFYFTPANGDIVRIYFVSAAQMPAPGEGEAPVVVLPEVKEVKVTTDSETINKFTLLRENVKTLEFSEVDFEDGKYEHLGNELNGTRYFIIPVEGIGIHVEVKEAAARNQVRNIARAQSLKDLGNVATGWILEPSSFIISDDTEIELTSGPLTGVENLESDLEGNNDVYNMQGICIKRAADSKDVKALPAGFYIIGGSKVLVK